MKKSNDNFSSEEAKAKKTTKPEQSAKPKKKQAGKEVNNEVTNKQETPKEATSEPKVEKEEQLRETLQEGQKNKGISNRKKLPIIFTSVGVAAVAFGVGVGLLVKDINTYYEVTTSTTVETQVDVESYRKGETVTLKAKEYEGYTFLHWEKGNEIVSTSSTYSFKLNKNTQGEYVAVYSINPYTIVWDTSVEEDTTYQGSQVINYGETVTLTAPEITGYTFSHWTKDNVEIEAPSTYIFTASESTEGKYVAVYTINSYTSSWTTSVETNDQTGTYTKEYGSSITFTAPTIEGYDFLYWKKGETQVSIDSTYTFIASESTEGDYVAVYELKAVALTLKITDVDDDSSTTVVTNLDYGTELTTSVLTAVVEADDNNLDTIDDSTTCGWYLDEECTIPADLTTITEATTLFTKLATLSKLEFTEGTKSYSVKATSTSITGAVVIPKMYNGYPVTAVADNGLNNCRSVTSIVVPSSVEVIGQYGLAQCTVCTSITLAEGVKTLGYRVFYYNITLESIKLPSTLLTIESYAFYNCNALLEITIPKSVTSFANDVFNECTKLKSIIFEEGSSLTTLGSYSFYYCESLSNIVLPTGITEIPKGAFYKSGMTYLDLSSYLNLTTIGNSAFEYSSLREIKLPSSVETIEDSAFSESDLSTIDLSICKNLKSIGAGAFSYTDIEDIYIPDSLTYLGDAFENCTSLQARETKDGINYLGNPSKPNLVLWIVDRDEELTSVTVDANTKFIYYQAFYNYTSLESIDLTNCTNLVSIGTYAFNGCTGLTSIDLSKCINLTSIGIYSFRGCTGLTSICLNKCSYLTSIEYDAFYNCTGLTSITLPNSVTSIGSEAFRNCTSLTSIDLSECTSLTSIGSRAFYGCTGLTSITLPSSVTSIDSHAFYDCSKLSIVYYCGTSTEWEDITIGSSYNTYLTSATRYYYSETEPSYEDGYTYWHYNEDNEIVIWTQATE